MIHRPIVKNCSNYCKRTLCKFADAGEEPSSGRDAELIPSEPPGLVEEEEGGLKPRAQGEEARGIESQESFGISVIHSPVPLGRGTQQPGCRWAGQHQHLGVEHYPQCGTKPPTGEAGEAAR